jgi:branched-chain amino acid transport system substrate-binding protein
MKFKYLFLFVASILVISAISDFSSSAYAQKEPYKIGVVFTAGGPYAAMGGPQKNSAFLAAEEINRLGGVNGHKLELIFEDDGGDPSVASRLAKKLIGENKVSAIVGGTPIPPAHAIALVCEEKKIPFISVAPTYSVVEGKRFSFMVSVPTDISAEALAKYIIEELRWKKVAIVHDTTEHTKLYEISLRKAFKEKMVETVSYEYKGTDTDLVPVLLKVREFNPDGIALCGSVPSAPAIFMKQRKEFGIKIPVIGPTSLTTQTFLNLVGEAGEGMMLQSNVNYGSQSPGAREFFEAMGRKYPGILPLIFHGTAWDAVKVFAKAMEVAGDDPLKIRDALENIKGFDGSRGAINLSPESHSGLTVRNLHILKIEKKKFVHIYTFK